MCLFEILIRGYGAKGVEERSGVYALLTEEFHEPGFVYSKTAVKNQCDHPEGVERTCGFSIQCNSAQTCESLPIPFVLVPLTFQQFIDPLQLGKT